MIVLKKVVNAQDAEILRQHRNSCREFMTRYTDYITAEQQQEWFKTASEKYDIFLAYEILHGAIIVDIGYGVIHKTEQGSLLTGGLIPEYRDKGLGKYLFKLLIDNCDIKKPIQLEVLKTNKRGFLTYFKLGFKVIKEDDKLFYMELQK